MYIERTVLLQVAHRQHRKSGVTPYAFSDYWYMAHFLSGHHHHQISLWDEAPTKSHERLGRLYDEDHVQDAMTPNRVSSQYPGVRKTKNRR